MEKSVLDCGAGGDCPPLALFYEHGFQTQGIELIDSQLAKAREYEQTQHCELHVQQGDMCQLPFADNSMGCVFSFGAVFHMKKPAMRQAIAEMKRVLKPGGLLFVNFLSTEDFRYQTGMPLGDDSFEQQENGVTVVHSYYQPEEGDAHFTDMHFVHKEQRTVERLYQGRRIRQGYIDYVMQKPQEDEHVS